MVLWLVVVFVGGDQSGGEIARMIVWVFFGVVRSQKSCRKLEKGKFGKEVIDGRWDGIASAASAFPRLGDNG